jgi:hypothetical protein
MDGTGIVQNGKTADNYVGLTAGGIEYFGREQKFSLVDIGMGAATAFLEGCL